MNGKTEHFHRIINIVNGDYGPIIFRHKVFQMDVNEIMSILDWEASNVVHSCINSRNHPNIF